jgi:YHS domain-containing protein
MKLFLALLATILVSGCATHATMRDGDGRQVMLAGHDPVAYFKVGGALRGTSELQVTHEGKTYYFATAAHQRAFMLDPMNFEPQFGGYCSNGVPYGFKTFADPREYEIKEGRLYVFADQMERQLWSLDPTFSILKGEEVWRSIARQPEFYANARATLFKPSWSRDQRTMVAEWSYRNPGVALAAKPTSPALARYAFGGRQLRDDFARSATAPAVLPEPVK